MAELAAAARSDHDLTVLGDRGDAAHHEVGCGSEFLHLAPLRRPVELGELRADRIVAARLVNVGGKAGLGERLGKAGEYLPAEGQQFKHPRSGSRSVLDNLRADAAWPEGCHGPGDPLVRGQFREGDVRLNYGVTAVGRVRSLRTAALRERAAEPASPRALPKARIGCSNPPPAHSVAALGRGKLRPLPRRGCHRG